MRASDMQGAYHRSAQAWQSGPERVYLQLARALVGAAPVPLAGAAVLDLGAGTGVASRVALCGGASRVVAVDNARAMLQRGGDWFRPVQADADALPFEAGSFDLVVAAMLLGHLADPDRTMSEARRVGGAIVASSFVAGWTHPAKVAVDEALGPLGFQPPAWYVRLKRDVEPQVDDPYVLHELATAAGYRDVRVQTISVATGLDTPAQLASWRLGMAHLAPFVQALPPAQRRRARKAAEAALVGAPPLVIPLNVLSAR